MDARILFATAMIAGVIAGGTTAALAKHVKVDDALMKTLDPDSDGTVSLDEAKTAGLAEFKKLNKDSDDTLDMKELGDRVSKKEFKDANPDKDKTLDEAEYSKLIEKLFKEADPDNDGTLDKKELESKAGQKLLEIIA